MIRLELSATDGEWKEWETDWHIVSFCLFIGFVPDKSNAIVFLWKAHASQQKVYLDRCSTHVFYLDTSNSSVTIKCLSLTLNTSVCQKCPPRRHMLTPPLNSAQHVSADRDQTAAGCSSVLVSHLSDRVHLFPLLNQLLWSPVYHQKLRLRPLAFYLKQVWSGCESSLWGKGCRATEYPHLSSLRCNACPYCTSCPNSSSSCRSLSFALIKSRQRVRCSSPLM